MNRISTSTNINRDANTDIHYIPTPNTLNVFKRLISSFRTGQHSFNIIGSYGTGKSSFLWAFEKNLNSEKIFFEPLNGQFNGIKEFDFFKIVGETESLRESLNQKLKIPTNSPSKDTFKALNKYYNSVEKKDQILVILIDEFGKYLEHASIFEPEKELYFVQQLAEFANNPNKNILLITTLHQNFGTYASGLNKKQKHEWDKVKGRLIDIAFDEPIEQLLFLASEHISSLNINFKENENFDKVFSLLNDSKLISNAKNLDNKLASKLYPIDYLAIYILTQALQKYGQNERSLFTFLSSDVLEKWNENRNDKVFFNVAFVYDYLVNYLSSELEDKDKNPHKSAWKSIANAIEKIQALDMEDESEVIDLIKVIGLVNIFGKPFGLLNHECLSHYAQWAMGIEEAEIHIDKLISQRIIKFFKSKNKYFFLDGTDLDFEQAYLEAQQNVNLSKNIAEAVNQYIDFNIIPAKRIQYEKGTPRYFEFKTWDFGNIDKDSITQPVGTIDGFINIVFGELTNSNDIEELSKLLNLNQVFVLVTDTQNIKNHLFEIAVHDQMISTASEDSYAQKILNEEKQFLVTNLREKIANVIYESSSNWFHSGEEKVIKNYKNLNQFLSNISEEIFLGVPTYVNEMVNKESLSGPILTARKKLLKALLENSNKEDLGFPSKKFPPEKTIYISLLKETKIHKKNSFAWELGAPEEKSFIDLWEFCEDFLNDSQHKKVPISELYDQLAELPFKLKRGFIDFWVPIFLIIRQEDYALFHSEEGYIPYLKVETLDLVHKKPSTFLIKAYQLDGVKINLFNKYKEITSLSEEVKGTESSFIKIFSNFYIFYNQLPEYTKATERLSEPTKKLRTAIKNSKDPEDALLVEFPSALGFHNLNLKDDPKAIDSFIDQLNASIYELRTAFSELVQRVETQLMTSLNLVDTEFTHYQTAIQERFADLKEHLLNKSQRVLYKRLYSNIDEREHYIISVADAIIGKNLNIINDEEELVLLDRIPHYIEDLEKSIELHKLKSIKKEDEVFYYEIHEPNKAPLKEKITLSKKDIDIATKMENDILEILNGNNKVSKAVLLKILKGKS